MSLLARLKRHTTWAFAPLLLPLSIIPIVFMAPALAESHASFKRLWLNRETVAAPAVTLTPAQRAACVAAADLPRRRARCSTYHGIDPRIDSPYTITPHAFAEQMAMLQQAGFHPISAAQYAKLPGRLGEGPALAPDPHHLRRRPARQLPLRRPDPAEASASGRRCS